MHRLNGSFLGEMIEVSRNRKSKNLPNGTVEASNFAPHGNFGPIIFLQDPQLLWVNYV